MKKNIIITITLVILLIYLFFLEDNKSSLAGKRINAHLYSYEINENSKNISGYTYYKDDIYYLLENNNEGHNIYTLYKRNIYSSLNQKIRDFTTLNTSCTLIDNYIECNNNDTILIYDFNFNKEYETTYQEEFPKIIPYKDTYIKYINNALYINQEDKEILLKTLPKTLEDSYVQDYFKTSKNTYLLMYNLKDQTHYIYNVNDSSINEINISNFHKFSRGFYFYNQDKFLILDLIDNNHIEYQNIMQDDYHFISTFSNNTIQLYTYDITSKYLSIINLKENTLQKVYLDISYPITNITYENNILYIETEDINNIYILNISELNLPKVEITDELKEEETSLKKKIGNIKEKYNLNIHIKEETKIKFPDFTANIENNNEIISNALVKIETILNKYNRDFFDSFYEHNFEGLNIYLTGDLKPINLGTQVSNPAAYSLVYDNKYMIALDINQPNIEELLCHELLHNLEFVLNNNNIFPFPNWNIYNPTDFTYNESYTSNNKYNYTINEIDPNNVYFVDYYSHTYNTEDRARVFEKICSCKSDSKIKNYPHLLSKGLYLRDQIYTYYPTLKDTSLFNSLD